MSLDLTDDLLIIDLCPHESECVGCGKFLINPRYAIAMYEGEPVPDDWQGEWGGFDACEGCYKMDRERNGEEIQ